MDAGPRSGMPRLAPRVSPAPRMQREYDIANWTEPRSFAVRYGRRWFAIPACLWFLVAPEFIAELVWGSMPRTFWPGVLAPCAMWAGLWLGSLFVTATVGRRRGGTVTIAPERREISWRRPRDRETRRRWSFDEIEEVKATTFSLTDVAVRLPDRRLRFTTNASGAPEHLARSLARAAGLKPPAAPSSQ